MGALVDVSSAVLRHLKLRGCVVTEITQYAYDFGQRRFHISGNGKETTLIIPTDTRNPYDVRPHVHKALRELGLEPPEFIQTELPL